MPGIILDSGTKPCLFEHLNIKIRPLCDTLCLQQFIIPLKLYSEDPAEFIAAALAPADVVSVQLADEGKACRVTVPADQLSLAIGKEGQNARLAARLTGYKIDIKAANAE